jgi:hypothetical protein
MSSIVLVLCGGVAQIAAQAQMADGLSLCCHLICPPPPPALIFGPLFLLRVRVGATFLK